jgi:hypothetical protein
MLARGCAGRPEGAALGLLTGDKTPDSSCRLRSRIPIRSEGPASNVPLRDWPHTENNPITNENQGIPVEPE